MPGSAGQPDRGGEGIEEGARLPRGRAASSDGESGAAGEKLETPAGLSSPGGAARSDSSILGRALGGDLPCAFCGYNLRGLSIRSTCPECGTPVRATILAVVDPLAAELRPISRPRMRAVGIVAWALGAAAAAFIAWVPQLFDLAREVGAVGGGAATGARPSVGLAVGIAIMLSMLGALTLVRVHAGVPRHLSAMAALGVVLYVPLAWTAWQHLDRVAMAGGSGYLTGWTPDLSDTRAGIAVMALTGAIVLLLRPVARVLVARSVVLRSGRVDRQTMWAMAVAAGLVIGGRAIGYVTAVAPVRGELAAAAVDAARIAAIGLVALGSALLTLGLAGSVADCVRIARAILVPAPTLRSVIRDGAPKSKMWAAPSQPALPGDNETEGQSA